MTAGLPRWLAVTGLLAGCGGPVQPCPPLDAPTVTTTVVTGLPVRVDAILYVFKGACPPAQDPATERLASNLVEAQRVTHVGATVDFAVSVPFYKLLSPPGPNADHCARLVFLATGEVRPGGPWPAQEYQDLRLAHRDSETFKLRPYATQCPAFGPLQGGDAQADLALYDQDGDDVPNLLELQLGLRPVDPDVLEPPGLPPVPLEALPAYSFGSDAADALSNEGPATPVAVGALEVDVVEVTNHQYRTCMGRVFMDGSGAPELGCAAPVVGDLFVGGDQKLGAARFDAHPVVGVTRVQAAAFCARRGMRLPTEWEWERAARQVQGAATQLEYPFGNTLPVDPMTNPCSAGRFFLYTSAGTALPCQDSVVMDTAPVVDAPGNTVRGRQANGLTDMAGNVAEWTDTPYVQDLHERLAVGGGMTTLAASTVHTVKGGSFRSGPRFVRTYARAAVDDASGSRAGTLAAVGFRCVR